MRIEILTPAQEAMLPDFRDKWTEIGLSTEPADRSMAEEMMIRAYANAGKAAPKIVWCGSPFSAALTRAIVNTPKFRDSVGASVLASVRDSVLASVGDSVLASVWDSVGDSVWDSVGASVRDSVRGSVGDSVRDSVRGSVLASVRGSVLASVRGSGYGQHDANWLGFYEYFREVCGLRSETEKLVPLMELAKCSGWYIPHEKICWMSERHSTLELDDMGQIHCEDGPAIAYPDGWEIYAIHGIRVQKWIVMEPEKITAEKIDAEDNIEVRRVMIERMGHAKYLQETGAQVVDVDYTPIGGGVEGFVMRALLRDKNGLAYLCGHDGSTDRVYYMSVDPEAKTCEDAHFSISGFRDKDCVAQA